MELIAQLAGGAATVLTMVYGTVLTVTAYRQMPEREPNPEDENPPQCPPISLIRPLHGIEPFSHATLKSTFELSPPPAEIIFCVESADDPVVAVVERLRANYPHIPSRLLVGRDIVSNNPKLNNLVKGWDAVTAPWIAFIDSNVLLPTDALTRLCAKLDDQTGLVCSPPAGAGAQGFAAHLECAFLNGYQAPWQCTVDALGYGFAQGKVMLFHRDRFANSGGIAVLGDEPAEDAAATKLVRGQGLKVRLVDRFFPQPIAKRTFADVYARQLRWAMLRRASFPALYSAEILSGGLAPLALVAIACVALDAPVLPIVFTFACLCYAAEAMLMRRLGWPSSLAAMVTRDALLPVIWLHAMLKRDFVWHGNAMRAERSVRIEAT